MSTGNLSSIAAIDHREAGTWTVARKGGAVRWRAIIVPTGSTHADLLRLARALHAEHPHDLFDIYDDDVELPKLVAAHGNDDVLPRAWRERHAVATLSDTVADDDAHDSAVVVGFQITEWSTLKTTKLDFP